MSLAQSFAEIEYPESDGKPMAETELHLEWMIDIRNRLKHRYRGQRVYGGANLLVYFTEGDPRQSVAPDGFVVKDCDPGLRRTFKTWEERRVPDVVFEVTSSSTRGEDERIKPATYARIGVKELFLFDPTGDYLDPQLQGYRFSRGRKSRIRPDASGALECRELGLLLRLADDALQLFDTATNERLLTEAEAADARARREHAAREVERAAREVAEAEVRRLREQIERNKGQ